MSTSTIHLSACVPRPYLIISIPKLLSRAGYIDIVGGPSICDVDMRGLLKVVPERGAGDKGGKYCIYGFAIDRYGELLIEHQQIYPDICTHTIFVKTHQLVSK